MSRFVAGYPVIVGSKSINWQRLPLELAILNASLAKWFGLTPPILCTEGNVRLIVKKHLQRGEQPDGLVADPWEQLDDFPLTPNVDSSDVIFRYRMSNRDVFYGGGVVNGARSITLANDAANRLMAKIFHNTGHCIGVERVRLYTPCFAGDYMEFHAKLTLSAFLICTVVSLIPGIGVTCVGMYRPAPPPVLASLRPSCLPWCSWSTCRSTTA